MRFYCSFLLVSSLIKLSFCWKCDKRCPEYLKCLVEEQAKKDANKTRQLFLSQPNADDDAPYLDEFETRVPQMLDMSASVPRNIRNGLRGPTATRNQAHYNRQLQEELYFQLKLHHEPGYCWQSEWQDQYWCAECANECNEDDELVLQKCNSTEPKQYYAYEAMPDGVGGRIKPMTNESLCWERTRVKAHQLKPCDDIGSLVNVSQIFRGFDFYHKFELHPFNRGVNTTHWRGPMCLSSQHHPKRDEVIRADDCANAKASARFTNTSFWIVHNAYLDSAYREGIAKVIDSNTVNGTLETNVLQEPVTVVATEKTRKVPTETNNELWSALGSNNEDARVDHTDAAAETP